MKNLGTFTKLRPPSLLRHLTNASENVCLQAFSQSVTWTIYIENGKIIYATHSVEPFDRLERHLRRLSYQVPALDNEVRAQVRLKFESDTHIPPLIHPEYEAISWLINEKYLQSTQAALIVQELVKEIIESFILIKEGKYELSLFDGKVPVLSKLSIDKLLVYSQERLQHWRSFAPQITSPFQRPYLLMKADGDHGNLPGIQQKLANWMKGFSLRHLAVIMNQDEVQLTHSLYPYILNGSILLHEPDPPFDKLPKTFDERLKAQIYHHQLNKYQVVDIKELHNKVTPINNVILPITNLVAPEEETQISPSREESIKYSTTATKPSSNSRKGKPAKNTGKKNYTIVSVDDSPTFLKEISRFLEDENFSVVTINDPVKAVMLIIRYKPDLILLDLHMEGIDGYELCRIIRNNSMFKKTPIIMVTGSKGIVDKVKARLVGASGYLTKPFTRADLLKMVFMHLT